MHTECARINFSNFFTVCRTGYEKGDTQWGRDQGWRVIRAEECWHRSLEPLMSEIRSHIGEVPVYLSFDIDSIDPSACPGTGTPEIGGLTTAQALEIVRGCRGLNLVSSSFFSLYILIVWKFHEFSISWLFREINFGEANYVEVQNLHILTICNG